MGSRLCYYELVAVAKFILTQNRCKRSFDKARSQSAVITGHTHTSGLWCRAVRDRPQGLLRVLIILIMTDFAALHGGTGALSARCGLCYSDVEKAFIV